MTGPKLIFVINSLHQGGAERVLSTLGNCFSRRGYKVTIVCMNHSVPGYPIEENVEVVTLVNHRGKQHLLNRLRYALLTWYRLFAVVLRVQPMCVISFMTSANLWTGLTCGLLRIPYIVSERNTPELTVQQLNPVSKWLSYHLYKHSRAVVLPAQGILNAMRLQSMFCELDNYRLIRNPVYEFPQTAKKMVHERKFILGIGRLTHIKGFDQLIDAFSTLKINNIDLLIIGVGPERARLQQQIDCLGLQDRIQLLGARNDLENYYRQASLFVLPSRHEGYPNVLVEAMSNGCACIAMDCEYGPAEIIDHGYNGVLVPAGNVAQLGKEMFNVLFDSKLKAAMGARAARIKQTNALELISDKWEELILNA